MKTLKIPFSYSDETFEVFIRSLQQIQTSIYHIAYNRASEGLHEIEIRSICRVLFPGVDSWIVQSAIKKGIGQFKADWELAKKQHREFSGKRIFGGKKNFLKRLKGLISKEEWKEQRLENLYIIGESLAEGNRKFEFNTDTIVFKPKKGIRFELVLPTLHGSYYKDYLSIVEATTNKALPITVSINKDTIFLSFDEEKLETIKPLKVIQGRYLGIDLNPNFIGVSFFDQYKTLLETKLYNFSELTGKNCNPDKLKHEIREVAIDIGHKAQHYQIQYLFVEDLSFKQGDKGKGKTFNRLTSNQFLITEFNRMLAKFGRVVKVNAAFSSTIGNILNDSFPDPIAASMEIARRGIESRVVKGSQKFYPLLVLKEVLERRWKDVLFPNFKTWIELHDFLKKTGLKYRVPIPKMEMFSPFHNVASQVYVFV